MKRVLKFISICLVLIVLVNFVSCKKEEAPIEYEYQFLNEQGSVIKSGKGVLNTVIEYPIDQVKEGNQEYSYEFIGWDNTDKVLTKDVIFKPIFKEIKNSYTYIFYDASGSVINSVTTLYGSTIEYPEDPIKEGSSEFSYEFIGWDNTDKVLTKNIEFRPIFNETTNQFTYTFYDVKGNAIKSETLNYGSAINYPENPIKEGNAEFSYEFAGWDNTDTVLTKDIEFRPIFNEVKNEYTYIFVCESGCIVKSVTAEYGSVIEYPEPPVKPSTQEYSYEFIGWDKNDVILTGHIDFYPLYKEVKNQYSYVFYDDLGAIIKYQKVDYGTTIEYPEDLIKDSDAEYTYTFKGWDNDVTVLTKNEEFRPLFDKVKNKYTYKFLSSTNEIISEALVEYGEMPIIPDAPDIDGYRFIGWDKEVAVVTKDVEYIATYEEFTSLEGMKLSILGDSISTFYASGSVMNSYYGGTNQFYYPKYSATIKTVESTWWYQLLNNNKMVLGINNSWSGSCAYGSYSSAGENSSRINTLDENGTPDIVIIYLGTNDCATGYTVEQFGGAIERIITKVKELGVKDIFITTLGYTAYTGSSYKEERRIEYNDAIRQIATKYSCGIVPLDEYIVTTSYSFYLGDNLHYNAKGAKLLAQIYEKSIKEYYGFSYDETIEVEHKEALPEGVIGKVTATANSDFWGKYSNNVFLAKSSEFISPTFSVRIEIVYDSATNQYVVSNILKSGDAIALNSDYVIAISDSHENNKAILADLEKVTVGCIVEFDTSLSFPVEVLFKEGNIIPGGGSGSTEEEDQEGKLKVGAYNTGVWTKYDTTVIAYSYDTMDKASTFVNFYIIAITKEESSDDYKVVYLKDVDVTAEFPVCDYYILIYRDLTAKSYYEETNLNTKITISGDITSGTCYLEFK